MFDSDRNGTIEGPELAHLLEILHDGEETSNMKLALKSFDFNGDGRIDFAEFKQLNVQFPSLLYPAFRIQQNMRLFTLGERWWRLKIEELHADKVAELARLQAAEHSADPDVAKAQREAAELTAKQKRQEQAIRIRMGCLQYHCCPCRRRLYIVSDARAADDSSDDSDDEVARPTKPPSPRATAKRRDQRDNVVKVGARKPLSQEERLERARKRRLRDMQDRPTRKD